MNLLIKTVLSKIKGIEMYMTAFPIIRCLVDGHEQNGTPQHIGGKLLHLCTRCKLVYWEEK